MSHNTVIVYCRDRARALSLRDAFDAQGFRARIAHTFKDVVGWLVTTAGEATVLVEIPRVDVIRKSVLEELRKVARTATLAQPPTLLALAHAVDDDVQRDLDRARIAGTFAYDADAASIAAAVSASLDGEPQSRAA